jgi:integrase
MTTPRLRLVTSTTENRTVTPRRGKNGELRTREHLTIDEVERLIEVAKSNRHGHRDALMVLLAFRHGLRPGEIVDLRWDQIDFMSGERVEEEVREALETIGGEARSRAWPALCFLRWHLKQHVWRTAMNPVKFDGYDVYPF